MSNPSPGASPDFHRQRELLDRALSLPASEREASVRRDAGDNEVLAATVLRLLADAEAPTRPLGDIAASLPAREQGVASTATAALMDRLEEAPKLDIGRYEFEGEVDRGGMGAIFKIHDRHLNRHLAMKVLLERQPPRDDFEHQLAHQLLGRFLEEAQVTSQLDHPGVVPVHELGLDQNGKVFFTMRLVKGRTASAVFRDAHHGEADWTVTRALEVILKVCDTMAYAHDKGVLHRDLKPSNVMVGRFGEVYVMDWGLAKVVGQKDQHDLRIQPEQANTISHVDSARKRDADTDGGSSVVSMDGQKLGTPSYMPPEQARSEVLDVRADIYAIGAMLYELLAGRAPYTIPGLHQPAYRILNDVVDGPPKRIEELRKEVPAELVAIVDKAMARDREGRYPNVTALAIDLRAFLDLRSVKAYRTGALVELKLWVRRNKPLARSLVFATLSLLAGTIVSLSFWRDADAQRQQAESAATHLQSERDAVVRYLQLMRSVAEIQEAEFALTTLEQNPDHKPAEVRSAKEHLKRRADDLKVALPKFQADIDAVQARGSSRGGEGDVSWSFFDPRDAALHEALLSNRLALRKLLASSSSKTIREEKWVYDGSGWGN
jgi:serine/threonine protein kinase